MGDQSEPRWLQQCRQNAERESSEDKESQELAWPSPSAGAHLPVLTACPRTLGDVWRLRVSAARSPCLCRRVCPVSLHVYSLDCLTVHGHARTHQDARTHMRACTHTRNARNVRTRRARTAHAGERDSEHAALSTPHRAPHGGGGGYGGEYGSDQQAAEARAAGLAPPRPPHSAPPPSLPSAPSLLLCLACCLLRSLCRTLFRATALALRATAPALYLSISI
jgi:hypothetical protein